MNRAQLAALLTLLTLTSCTNTEPTTTASTETPATVAVTQPATTTTTVAPSTQPAAETLDAAYRRLDAERNEAIKTLDAERFATVVNDPDQIAALDSRITERRIPGDAASYTIDQVWEWASGDDWALIIATDTRTGPYIDIDADTGEQLETRPGRTRTTQNYAVLLTQQNNEWVITDDTLLNLRADPEDIAVGELEHNLTLDNRDIQVWAFPLELCVLQPDPYALICLDQATAYEWRTVARWQTAIKIAWAPDPAAPDVLMAVAITPRGGVVLADGAALDHEPIRDGSYNVTAGTIALEQTFEISNGTSIFDTGTFADPEPGERRSAD